MEKKTVLERRPSRRAAGHRQRKRDEEGEEETQLGTVESERDRDDLEVEK